MYIRFNVYAKKEYGPLRPRVRMGKTATLRCCYVLTDRRMSAPVSQSDTPAGSRQRSAQTLRAQRTNASLRRQFQPGNCRVSDVKNRVETRKYDTGITSSPGLKLALKRVPTECGRRRHPKPYETYEPLTYANTNGKRPGKQCRSQTKATSNGMPRRRNETVTSSLTLQSKTSAARYALAKVLLIRLFLITRMHWSHAAIPMPITYFGRRHCSRPCERRRSAFHQKMYRGSRTN